MTPPSLRAIQERLDALIAKKPPGKPMPKELGDEVERIVGELLEWQPQPGEEWPSE